MKLSFSNKEKQIELLRQDVMNLCMVVADLRQEVNSIRNSSSSIAECSSKTLINTTSILSDCEKAMKFIRARDWSQDYD